MSQLKFGPAAAVGAMVLALGIAAFEGRPAKSAAAETPPAWASQVETAQDHITAADFVTRVLSDPASLAIVDVRPAEEFAEFHLTDSVNLDLPRLLGAEGKAFLAANAAKTVVLVSNGMTHPAQAWTELARRGATNVRILEDGLDGLRSGELAPPSLRGMDDEHAARMAKPRWLAARRALVGGDAPLPAFGTFATDPARIAAPTVVSVAWLAAHRDDVVVLDARTPPEAYAAGHLPGSHHVPIDRTRAALNGVPDQLLPVPQMAALWGSLGIGTETQVVVVSEDKLQDAAHLALALLTTGHRAVAILEGGLPAWVASGRELSKDVPAAKAVAYEPRAPLAEFAVDIDAVAAASAAKSAVILDVRPAKAYTGEEKPDARAGHIPGAIGRELTAETVFADGVQRWKSREELVKWFGSAGLAAGNGAGLAAGDAAPIVSCRTGHQAAQTWYLLKFVLGVDGARWYDGSWKEWSARTDLPVETGPARK